MKLTYSLVFVLSLTTSACWDTGHGEKVGQIIKLNQQGGFCKTWEAELIRGGLNNGSGASSTLFDFTIEDVSLLPDVQRALDEQYEVKIHYNMEGFTACRSDSKHFLQKVERMAAGHPLEVIQPAPTTLNPKELKKQELLRQLKEFN